MANKSNSHDAYPKQVKLSDGTEVTIRRMDPKDQEKILKFANTLPQDDLLFLRTDITDPAIVKEWAENLKRGRTHTLLAESGDEVVGYGSIHSDHARWTKRVGEIRILSSTRFRSKGLGRRLASEIFSVAEGLGLKKLTAQMTTDQAPARAAFERLGFRVEAVLTDWVEDRAGHPRDMLVMTYDLAGFTDHVVANP